MTTEQDTATEATEAPDDLTAETNRLVDNMAPEELQEEVDAAAADLTEENQQQPGEPAEDEPTEQDRPGDPLAKVRREAAGYRVKLREAESERERLAGVVEAMQRSEAERVVSDRGEPLAMAEGADLWRGGVELSELLGEDGTPDREKMLAARKRVLEQHPHWAHRIAGGFDGGVRTTVPVRTDPAAGFSERLRDTAGQ